MDEQVLETESMKLRLIINVIIAREIYIHKLTSSHRPGPSAVQSSVDFPAISTQL